ncbi:pyruvate dehydrogenase, decarboxylase component E1, thiamin-binding [Haemophilus influenzae]|uniref:Pyruvate dehydrogenase, decarboxylase component E1, thiamin-binding n=1 Tax=Haemophilus influenzae TaxID=727 RepID=A0A2X1PP41_HAEIF|nr:pyruvate dehydrogenase, decarboxylase component E1, thiamin-binding [Haemophilus influenzae]
MQSLDSLIREEGVERAQYIVEQVIGQARTSGVSLPTGVTTDYVNTIPVAEQPAYPGDHAIERRIRFSSTLECDRDGFTQSEERS